LVKQKKGFKIMVRREEGSMQCCCVTRERKESSHRVGEKKIGRHMIKNTTLSVPVRIYERGADGLQKMTKKSDWKRKRNPLLHRGRGRPAKRGGGKAATSKKMNPMRGERHGI